MLTGRLPDGREEIHMKKLTALLLALVMMLAAAAAEQVTQATLLFAYGDEAFDMHMREKANTIDYGRNPNISLPNPSAYKLILPPR